MQRRSGNRNTGPDHNRYKHGMAGTPTYKSWSGMKARCFRENRDDYRNYGARGITVCDRWLVFENFLEDMGVKPLGTTLERINNDGNYEPGNCMWATRTTQSRNRRYVRMSARRAAQLRAEREAGATLEALAAHYGISVSHTHRIVSGESWV